MKALSKKILTACLALMIAIAMAVPAFATDYEGLTYRPYNVGFNSLNLLNVFRNEGDPVAEGKNLILYETTSAGVDQLFNEVYVSVQGMNGYVIQLQAQPDYAVNRSSNTGSAILYSWNAAGNIADSAFERIDRYDQPAFRLKYGASKDQYLCYASDSPWARVYFSKSGLNRWDC